MTHWTAEFASKAEENAASADRCASGFVTSAAAAAAAAAASPSADSTTSPVALGPTPSALAADPDVGRERAWKELYVKL